MSDEFDSTPESNNFSSFWPLLILVVALLIWFGYQDYQLNSQRSAFQTAFQDKQFQTTIAQAQNIESKYKSLVSDLVDTAQKNSAAAQIVRDAIQAGMLHLQQNPSTSTDTPPADSSK